MASILKNSLKKPYFTLHLCDPRKHFSVSIFLDGELIHKITNFKQFSKEIGYPDLSEKVFESKGDYYKDNALLAEPKELDHSNNADANNVDVAANACFQLRLAKYLFKNCEAFKGKYAGYYVTLMGACMHYSILNAKKCDVCYMHPINHIQCAKV